MTDTSASGAFHIPKHETSGGDNEETRQANETNRADAQRMACADRERR